MVHEIPCWWFWSQRRSSIRKTHQDWWRQNKGIDQVKPTLHNTRDCRNIEHPSFKRSWPPEETGIRKQVRYLDPHELKEVHLTARINICDMFIKREENDSFLKRLITGDEKWIIYNNVVRKRSLSRRDDSPQTISKTDIHQRKVMLSVMEF